jgi:hypothetical protein
MIEVRGAVFQGTLAHALLKKAMYDCNMFTWMFIHSLQSNIGVATWLPK